VSPARARALEPRFFTFTKQPQMPQSATQRDKNRKSAELYNQYNRYLWSLLIAQSIAMDKSRAT